MISGQKSVWCIMGTKNGEAVNSCDDDIYFESKYDCYESDTYMNLSVPDNGVSCHRDTINVSSDIGEYTTSQAEIQNDYDYYLKHTVENGVITESYACFISDTEHCLKGGDSGSSFGTNTGIIQAFQTYNNLGVYDSSIRQGCYYFDDFSKCSGGGYYEIEAQSDGVVEVFNNAGDYYCDVDRDGSSECGIWFA